MSSLDDKAQRGREAEQILAHPLFAEAFDTISQEVLDAWKASPARDVEGREKLFLTLKLLDRVKAQIVAVMQDGQTAQATLTQRLKAQVGMSARQL